MKQYLQKVTEKLDLIRTEAYEKIKRAGTYIKLENPELQPMDIAELHLDLVQVPGSNHTKSADMTQEQADQQKEATLDR
jgi:hypothetical protein